MRSRLTLQDRPRSFRKSVGRTKVNTLLTPMPPGSLAFKDQVALMLLALSNGTEVAGPLCPRQRIARIALHRCTQRKLLVLPV